MSETMSLVFAFAAGVLLGAIFFGGLWLTVRHGISSRRPGLWFMGSILLRMGIAMTGFYLLLGLPGDSWKILLAGLPGFVIARLAATQFLPAPLSALLLPEWSILPGTGLSVEKSGSNHEVQRGSHAP